MRLVRNRWGGRTFGIMLRFGRNWAVDFTVIHRRNDEPPA